MVRCWVRGTGFGGFWTSGDVSIEMVKTDKVGFRGGHLGGQIAFPAKSVRSIVVKVLQNVISPRSDRLETLQKNLWSRFGRSWLVLTFLQWSG